MASGPTAPAFLQRGELAQKKARREEMAGNGDSVMPRGVPDPVL
jgi:hypothetical protein